MLTISGLERAMNCLASELQPQAKSADTEDRKGGRVVHAFLKNCNLHGRDDALAMADEEDRPGLALIDTDKLPLDGEKFAPEVSFAYDPEADTARELARGDDSRSYPEGPYLCGTTDLVGVTPDAVIVIDWKGPHATLTPAKENYQLIGYCVAAARAYGRTKAIAALGRIRDDGTPFFDHAEFGMFDLDAAAEEIRKRWAQLQAPPARARIPVEGAWCRWCPAFNSCSAKTALAASLAAGESAFPAVLDETNARAVYERLQVAQAVLTRVDAVLREYARTHPVDLGDGYVFGEVKRPVESLDPIIAEKVLAEYGLMGAVETVTKLTKSALSAEIRAQVMAKYPGPKPKGILGGTEKKVLGKLREVGAATTAHQRIVTRFKAKPGQLPAAASAVGSVEAESRPRSGEPAPSLEVIAGGLADG